MIRALNDIGDDLLHMAAYRTFPNPWRKWLSTAACIVLVISLATVALPYLPIGCGASKSEAPMATQESMEEPTMEDAAVEEAIPEEFPMEEPAAEAETESSHYETGTDMVVYGGTYYYLNYDIVLPGQTPANLGEELGVTEAANREHLTGCKVYAVQYATWYGNHAVNGVSVPNQIYVETADGFVYGMTYNEKIVSRYTADDVRAALTKGDHDWILRTFVRPLEMFGVTTIADGQTSSEQMNRLFLASLDMNTGVTILDQWRWEQGKYIPAEDVRWRLERFLDHADYDPSETTAYVPDSGCIYLPDADYTPSEVALTYKSGVLEDDTLYLWVTLPNGGEKYYEIRFDEDSWRYVNVLTPDSEP